MSYLEILKNLKKKNTKPTAFRHKWSTITVVCDRIFCLAISFSLFISKRKKQKISY